MTNTNVERILSVLDEPTGKVKIIDQQIMSKEQAEKEARTLRSRIAWLKKHSDEAAERLQKIESILKSMSV